MEKLNKASGTINTAVSPASIPITIPSPALAAIGDGYEFVETLAFPQRGSGGVYNQGVFEDVMNALKLRPIPGDRRGHQENPNDDFFVIGGKIEGNEAHFRVRVPELDYSGMSNDGFIRSLKTGNQQLSLVLDVEPDGTGQFNKLLSTKGLRNDAVGTLPAMKDQSVYANKEKEAELLALARSGEICENGGDELIVGGRVNLTAVKKIKPLDSPLRNRILDAAKNKSVHKENNKMEESEMKKLLDEMQKIATKTVEATFENQFKEKEIKKNAADIEQAQKILELARETLGEEAADKEADEIFAELVKVLKAAEESGAESEANKFVGAGLRKNKDGKDTPIFLEAKARFLALGPKVFVRRNCEKLHEELRGNETFKLLRQSELNPVGVATSEFQSGESF